MKIFKKKNIIFFLIILFFCFFKVFSDYQDAGKIAQALNKRLTVKYYRIILLNHAEISMKIDMRKGEAYLYSLEHELFRMKAKYVDFSTSKISIAKNWIELQGNGGKKLYLDILRKILFFRSLNSNGKWEEQIFATVSLKVFKNGKIIQVKISEHKPIKIDLITAKKKAWVYFNGEELFIMHAKKIKVKGSPFPIIELKYMKRYKDGLYLNFSRKILFFRSGKKGIFSTIKYKIVSDMIGAKDYEPLYHIVVLNHSSLSILLNMEKRRALFYSMGHEIFRAKASYVEMADSSISISKNWIELKGNGRVKLYIDLAKKILFFRVKDKTGRREQKIFAYLSIKFSKAPSIINIKILKHKPITIDYLPVEKKAFVRFDECEVFVMHAKKIKIRGSNIPIIKLKYMNGYKEGLYLNLDRKILYFRKGKKGIFAYIEYELIKW